MNWHENRKPYSSRLTKCTGSLKDLQNKTDTKQLFLIWYQNKYFPWLQPMLFSNKISSLRNAEVGLTCVESAQLSNYFRIWIHPILTPLFNFSHQHILYMCLRSLSNPHRIAMQDVKTVFLNIFKKISFYSPFSPFQRTESRERF